MVGYNTTYVIVGEIAEVVQLCAVVMSGEYLRPFNLSVSTINATAGPMLALNYVHISNLYLTVLTPKTDTSDYETVSGEGLVFSATDTEQCHYINITEDRECEYDGCESEFFMSQLSTDDYNVQLVNSTAQIIIEDSTEDECSKVIFSLGHV